MGCAVLRNGNVSFRFLEVSSDRALVLFTFSDSYNGSTYSNVRTREHPCDLLPFICDQLANLLLRSLGLVCFAYNRPV